MKKNKYLTPIALGSAALLAAISIYGLNKINKNKENKNNELRALEKSPIESNISEKGISEESLSEEILFDDSSIEDSIIDETNYKERHKDTLSELDAELYTELATYERTSISETDYEPTEYNESDERISVTNSLTEDSVVFADGFMYMPIPENIKKYIYGKSYKENCTIPYSDLRYVLVKYVDFKGNTQSGDIICNKAIAQDLVEIFYELYVNSYPIESVLLVDEFNADDELSMEANNSSCFNFRTIPGQSTLSNHAKGLAIDINPFYNPYVTSHGITPIGSEYYADRNNDFPYKITTDDLCYKLFIQHGFTWGGAWKNSKDYQHFEKKIG